MDSLNCQRTNIRVLFEMNQWQMSLGRFDLGRTVKGQPYVFEAFKPHECPEFDLGHVTLEVPSGELWIQDALRIPEWQKLAQQVQPNPELNSEWGRFQHTQTLAQNLNVAIIHVGNTSPGLYLSPEGMLMGGHRYDADAPSTKDTPDLLFQQNVCTDRWTVEMVDKQVLLESLSREMGSEQAVECLESYAKTQQQDLIRIYIQPGQAHLYFVGHPKAFGRHFKMNEVDVSSWEQPMFVLSPQALTLQLQPKQTPDGANELIQKNRKSSLS